MDIADFSTKLDALLRHTKALRLGPVTTRAELDRTGLGKPTRAMITSFINVNLYQVELPILPNNCNMRSFILALLKCAEMCQENSVSVALDIIVSRLATLLGPNTTADTLRGLLLYATVRLSRHFQRRKLHTAKVGVHQQISIESLWLLLIKVPNQAKMFGLCGTGTVLQKFSSMPGSGAATEMVVRARGLDPAIVTWSLRASCCSVAAMILQKSPFEPYQSLSLIGTITKLLRHLEKHIAVGEAIPNRDQLVESMIQLSIAALWTHYHHPDHTDMEFALLKCVDVAMRILGPLASNVFDVDVHFPEWRSRLATLARESGTQARCVHACHNPACVCLQGISEAAMRTVLCSHGCRTVRYCSMSCEQADFGSHTVDCK